MKNTSLILNGILGVAVIVLYVLFFSSKGSNETNVTKEGVNVTDASPMKIAYIKVDSLIMNYDLAKDLQDDFSKSQDAYTKEYANKRSAFEKRAAAFQERMQNGGFLTQDLAAQERDRLMNEQQEIQKLDQELSGKLADLQSSHNEQLVDSLLNYLKDYNFDKKYKYIFNAGGILIGDEDHNITKEVLDGMNIRYSKEKK